MWGFVPTVLEPVLNSGKADCVPATRPRLLSPQENAVRMSTFRCSPVACRSRIWQGCTMMQSRTIPSSAQHWGPTQRCCTHSPSTDCFLSHVDIPPQWMRHLKAAALCAADRAHEGGSAAPGQPGPEHVVRRPPAHHRRRGGPHRPADRRGHPHSHHGAAPCTATTHACPPTAAAQCGGTSDLWLRDAATTICQLTCDVLAWQGGKAAAETMLDMRVTGDYSRQSTKEYQRRWIQLFGHDFHMVRRDCV
jgi:hypothetical protein